MPASLVRFFERKDLSFHLALALVLGLTLRLITAHFNYGPMSIDDFGDGVIPSLILFKGGWPGLNIGRSYLLVGLLTGFLKIGEPFGLVTDGIDKVRWIYGSLGVLSLGTVVGAYWYARDAADKTFGALLLYLMSLYFFMPLLATRTFGETVSMPLIMMGVGLLQLGRKRSAPGFFIPGFVFLAVACLFRFQNGIIFLSSFSVLLFERRPKLWRAVLIGGITWTVAQATVDWLSYGKPFESFLGHLFVNRHGGAEYGSQPWHVHVAALLGYSLFPFSLVLVRGLRGLRSKEPLALYPLLAFVLIHTFIAHKEERFMAPILPLFLVLLASVWAELKDSAWVRRLYFPTFAVVNLVLLGIVTMSNSQGGLLNPVVDIQAQYHSGIFADTNSELANNYATTGVFLNPEFSFTRVSLASLEASGISSALKQSDKEAFVVLAFPDEGVVKELGRIASYNGPEVRCSPIREGSSLSDRLIYFLNPKRNIRRRPTLYTACEKAGALVSE